MLHGKLLGGLRSQEAYLVRLRELYSRYQDVVEPHEAAFDDERLFLQLVRKDLPAAGRRAVVDQAATACDCNESAVCTQG